MRVFYSEYLKDYSSYTFSYAPYCLFESREKITEIYDAGFLPYTGNPEIEHHIYYMARSLRIPLERFSPGSENRRVFRKMNGYVVESEWCDMEKIAEDEDFRRFCLNYCDRRFSEGVMTPSRLDYILHSPFATGVIRYSIDGRRAGEVLISHNEDILHYWYCFYELEAFEDLPLGKLIMTDVIRQAAEKGYSYIYLGTCYGTEALYKVRDFRGVEFFDGSRWRTDLETLKAWCKADGIPLPSDRLKLSDEISVNEKISLISQNHHRR